jgi:hypothetical protein
MFRTSFPPRDNDRARRQQAHTGLNCRYWYSHGGPTYRSWLEPQSTSCEGDSSDGGSSSRPLDRNSSLHGEISPDNPYKDQIEEMRRGLEEPCKACMYTGVSVCLGMSLYFVKLATDDTTLPKNRRFLWMCSASSVAAGAYRWYLG